VIHIIHNGESIGTGTNISDAQIKATLDYTNKIYANAIGSSTNFRIQFVMACIDKNGNKTSGIERINGNTVTGYYPNNHAVLNDNSLSNSINKIAQNYNWDVTQYYNVYVIQQFNIANVAGVAFYPNNYIFQSDATFVIAACFKEGNPTLPHEFGHSLNLAHTFSNGCSTPTYNCLLDGDGVCDTPPHEQNDCNDVNTCISTNGQPNKNSKYNYMSYCHVFGVQQNLFTLGQNERSNASLSLVSRASLVNNAYSVASCNINVKKYAITTIVKNGNISSTVNVDSNSNYTVTYNSLIKAVPDSIIVNGVNQPISATNQSNWVFSNITTNQKIQVIYNLDTSYYDTSTCSQVIYQNNFDNNIFDTSFWKRTADQVADIRVESGILKLEQNVTDKYTNLGTKWTNTDTNTIITLEKNNKVHYDHTFGSEGTAGILIFIKNWENQTFVSKDIFFKYVDSGFISIGYNEYSYGNLFGIYLSIRYKGQTTQIKLADAIFDTSFWKRTADQV
ncbi:MAG: M43 family zinc metalloprotease, partial [Sediminibacterium sp.]|nr:M43 family zinc metalloprotease [Sediminibacterium sp.]